MEKTNESKGDPQRTTARHAVGLAGLMIAESIVSRDYKEKMEDRSEPPIFEPIECVTEAEQRDVVVRIAGPAA